MKDTINIWAILNEVQHRSIEERHKMAIDFDVGTTEVQKHFFAAYTLYLQLAREGHAPSQYWIGLAYFRNLLCANNNRFLNVFTKESLLPKFIEHTLAAYTVYDNKEYYMRVQDIIKNNLIAAKYWLELAVAQGHVNAMFLLGEMYLEGKCGTNTDYDNLQIAKKYFEQAKEHGDPLSICRLAELASTCGEVETAIFLYQQAANLGCAAAQCNLGLRYKCGEGVEKNMPLAIEYIQQAANAGHPMAQYHLSMEYINANVLKEDHNAAVEWCLKAAEGGYAAAQNIIGLRYAGGTGLAQNMDQAIYWYEKAAAQKWPDAQFNLAVIYDKYADNMADINRAIGLYKKAAANTHIEAAYNLGDLYQNLFNNSTKLNIIAQDVNNLAHYFAQTILWYSKAAEHQHEYAAYNLGSFYFALKNQVLLQQQLNITEEDINKAGLKWFSMAAQQGHALAQYNLSLMYKYGDGVTQNFTMANKLFAQAVAQGTICCQTKPDVMQSMNNKAVNLL